MDERPSGGELYYYPMHQFKKCMVMIPTWHFSSSKRSLDISQLNVTQFPAWSVGVLHQGNHTAEWVTPSALCLQGVGDLARVSAPPTVFFYLGVYTSLSSLGPHGLQMVVKPTWV